MIKDATQVVSSIKTGAVIKNKKRVINKILPTQWVRQGDVYVINVNDLTSIKVFKDTVEVNLKSYTKEEEVGIDGYQLVPGITSGSRHIVESGVDVFTNPTNNSSLVGCLVKSNKAFNIRHPEHDHFEMPAGEYLICYQLNVLTKKRVRD